eukprot:scaffold141870_cov24-Tisochrysis_lutea.AAC.1
MATTREGGDTKSLIYGIRDPARPSAPTSLEVPRQSQLPLNPITWSNAPPEKPRRRPDLDEERARAEARQAAGVRPLHSGAPTTLPAPPPAIDAESLQQTWGQLLRTGKAPLSVATSLVSMPPEFGAEPPPREAPASLTSINAIGVGPGHAGIHAHHPRSQHFSKTFSDPFA